MLAITVAIDYSYDTFSFFDTQAKKDLLQMAADSLAGNFSDELLDITPGAGPASSWTASFPAPDSGANTSVTNLTVPTNTVIVYAGARDLGGSADQGYSVGRGGTGDASAGGPPAWRDRVLTRGQSGALASPASDFGPWGGAITFTTNPNVNWHFGATTTGLDAGEVDFLSVAMHELAHLLGYGGADSWTRHVDNTLRLFNGPMSVAEYDGAGDVPLAPDLGHWAMGTVDGGPSDSHVSVDRIGYALEPDTARLGWV